MAQSHSWKYLSRYSPNKQGLPVFGYEVSRAANFGEFSGKNRLRKLAAPASSVTACY